MFPSAAGEEEDDVKSIRSHRIKLEASGNSLEESMEECRVEEMSMSKVRKDDWRTGQGETSNLAYRVLSWWADSLQGLILLFLCFFLRN